MLKKTITYTNFDDAEVTEDFYFNLTKAELIEMEVSHQNGLDEYLKRIVAQSDSKKIFAEFKAIIMLAVGQKSEDGKRFVKNDEITQDFIATEAFSELIVEFMTDPNAAAEFMKGVVPAKLSADVDTILKKQSGQTELEVDKLPTLKEFGKVQAPTTLEEFENERRLFLHENAGAKMPPELTTYTLNIAEMTSLDTDELKSGLASGKYVLGAS